MSASKVYLKTVDRALQVLLQFDEAHPVWSADELAAVLGLHRSIIYRILATLEHSRFVTQNGKRGMFRLGPSLVSLGNVVLSGIDLRQVAAPRMADVVRETGETAFLTVLSGDESVCIDKVESPIPIRVTLTIGSRHPLHAGASNKILLAYLPKAQIETYIAEGLNPITPNTIVEADLLKKDLEEIRRKGFAFSIGELTPGMAAIGAPILDSNGSLEGALSISGLSTSFGDERLPMLVQAVCRAAEDISSQLLTWKQKPTESGPYPQLRQMDDHSWLE
ncbi:MAG: IclR family transcriptional regulator [Anaerolineales bacterium]